MVSQTDIEEKLEVGRGDMPFPMALAGWEIETGFDATGDPAVWVWVIIHDDRVEQVWPLTFRDDVRDRVRQAVRDLVGPEGQVYVRFRSQTEQQELTGEAWPR